MLGCNALPERIWSIRGRECGINERLAPSPPLAGTNKFPQDLRMI